MSVKPLTAQSLSALCARIDFARNGEIRSITPLSASSIEISMSVQDSARGHDWINVIFRVDGVSDARLVSDNALKILSMEEGISAEIEAGRCGFALGNYAGRLDEAPLYVIGISMGYEEKAY